MINKIDISVFSLFILLFIYANARKQIQRSFLQNQLFLGLVVMLFIATAAEGLSNIFDGLPDPAFIPWNWAANTLLFMTAPIPVLLWVLYSDLQVNHDEKRTRKFAAGLSLLLAVNTIITLASLQTGWYFTIGSNNVYHRGPFFQIHQGPYFLLLLYAIVYIFINRKKLNRRHFYTLLFFAVPSIVGACLQTIFYGVALTACAMTLSILLIYFNIQDKNLNTDYLTGTYNRRLLDNIVRERISACAKGRTFSGILIDLDNFKQINDTHGHDVGDEALLQTVAILKNCLRANDIIARYGGDEFLILLDIVDASVLTDTIQRIKAHFVDFNQSMTHPYTLSFSYGYDVYEFDQQMDSAEFIKHLDTLMYRYKKLNASS
jgi:diguanylate cyclase (GGDEF)-like protein